LLSLACLHHQRRHIICHQLPPPHSFFRFQPLFPIIATKTPFSFPKSICASLLYHHLITCLVDLRKTSLLWPSSADPKSRSSTAGACPPIIHPLLLRQTLGSTDCFIFFQSVGFRYFLQLNRSRCGIRHRPLAQTTERPERLRGLPRYLSASKWTKE
jgi:hypothetical protein